MSYCSYCATYGHFTRFCEFYTERKVKDEAPKILLEIKEEPKQITICKSDKALKAFLYFWKLSVCQSIESNIRNITKFCKEKGWAKPIFVEPAENVDEEKDEDDTKGKKSKVKKQGKKEPKATKKKS